MANDHYVARTYLKRWCDRAAAKPMRAYRKSDGTSFPCWPEAVCAEADGDLNPKYFQDPAVLGQFRSIFEPRWDAALDAIEKQKITADDKFVIAGYWANLLTATPAWRKIGQQLYAQELQSIAPIISKNLPPPASLKDVKLTVEVDEDYIKAVVTRNLLSGALQLYHQAWTVLTNATAHEFLTGDNPSGIFPPNNVGGPVVRILPLSPRLCISTIMERQPALKTNLTQADFAAPPRGDLTYQAVVPEGVKLANRLTVVNAERFVFSRAANSGVEALVKKWGDYSAQLEHSSTTTSSGIKTEAKLFVGRNRR
jgi:hypothetical protein